MQDVNNRDSSDTTRCLLAGLLGAILINIPIYSWIFERDWDWANGFPLRWLAIGVIYTATFFHELGHTAFGWFYGYFSLPSFDFQYGGGMAYNFSGYQIPIICALYAAMGYGIYLFREYLVLQIAIGLLFVFHVVTAYNENLRTAVMAFMGPAMEPIVGGVFLYRALANLVTRVPFERWANAAFGFGFIFQAMMNGWGLLHNEAHRTEYYNQKGAHAVGDFDKIADVLWVHFDSVVMVWLGLCVVSLVIPFALFWFFPRYDYQLKTDGTFH